MLFSCLKTQNCKQLFKVTFVLVIIASSILSCDPRRVYEQNISLPDASWDKKNVLTFDVPISDTIHAHSIYFNIRNGSKYPYSNLYLFVTTYSPRKDSLCDTVELTLADEKGKWYGSGIGDIADLRVPYKRKVLFPHKGTYRFKLAQGMRNDKLPAIMDAGIRIERATE